MCYTHQRHSEDVDSMIIFTEPMIYAYGYDKYIRCFISHYYTHYYFKCKLSNEEINIAWNYSYKKIYMEHYRTL